MTWILASGSPRRAEILRCLGIEFTIYVPAVDEAPLPGEGPEAYVDRMSREKAAAVGSRFKDAWIIAGDTAVIMDGEILGKPRSGAEAVDMLLRLQGRNHVVASGLALLQPAGPESGSGSGEKPSLDGRTISAVDMTEVRFRPFDRSVAEAYVRTGEPMDKAGAYGIQGKGASLVERIQGDYTGVVGLSVSVLVRLLADVGRPYTFGVRPGRDYESA